MRSAPLSTWSGIILPLIHLFPALLEERFQLSSPDANSDTDSCALSAIYLWDLFKLATAPLPREVYEQRNGFTSSYSGITFTYDDSNATEESFPASFVDPSDPNDPNAAPDPKLWTAFEGKAPIPVPTEMCAIHVDEFQDCADVYSNLFASVTVKDSDGNVLGETTVNDTYPLGMPINVGDTYAFSFNELASTALMITGEHAGDYIQFTLGTLSWTSRTTTGVATCRNGGWDPKDGPICAPRTQRHREQNAVCSCATSGSRSALQGLMTYPNRKIRSTAKSRVRPSCEFQRGTQDYNIRKKSDFTPASVQLH